MWEAENRISIPVTKRLEQFIMLFDLCNMYDSKILKRMNTEHLNAIIETNRRLCELKEIEVRNQKSETGDQKSEIRI
jgi:hypothetical protein